MEAKNKKADKEMTIHIRVDSPNVIRKEILALTIDTIEMIKKFRDYKKAKKQKQELMKDLRQEVMAIKRLMKELTMQDLPLNMSDVESLPIFKKQKEAIKKIEKVREKSEQEWATEELTIERDIAKEPKAAPKVPKKKAKPKPKPKPKDKLEADLEALRAKMAQL